MAWCKRWRVGVTWVLAGVALVLGSAGMAAESPDELLSSTGAQASAFWQSGLEAMLFRLPTRGWQFNFFVSAEDYRYFNAPSVDSEQVVMALAQVTKDLGRKWKSTLGMNYLYQNQVFDFSATYTNTGIGQVIGHTLAPRWNLRKQLGVFWVEAQFGATRQLLEEPLDSYWQLGPRATVGLTYGHGSELSLSYQWTHLAYDTREDVDANGAAIPGTSLTLEAQPIELILTHEWDEKRRWQTATVLGFENNQDNGSGFYDYQQYRLAQQVRFKTSSWEIAARARVSYNDYETQTVSATDPSRRHRLLVTAGLRAERKLSEHWRIHASYYYEQSFSDLDFDQYQANTVMGGVTAEF
jgi:hypothetical protein